MMTKRIRTRAARVAAPLGVTVALLSTLTACTTAADVQPEAEAEVPIDAAFSDGIYEAEGDYQSPNGAETIGVQLTIENNVVTDVQITTNPTNPTTAVYQSQFASGIAGVAVGKNLNELDVTVVAGSSLTGNGFREALTAIKADAVES